MSVRRALLRVQSVILLAYGLATLCGAPLASQVPVPSAANFDAWREHILPVAGELRWATIPWHQSFGEGLLAANRQGKPLLFYTMNGHPLGCT